VALNRNFVTKFAGSASTCFCYLAGSCACHPPFKQSQLKLCLSVTRRSTRRHNCLYTNWPHWLKSAAIFLACRKTPRYSQMMATAPCYQPVRSQCFWVQIPNAHQNKDFPLRTNWKIKASYTTPSPSPTPLAATIKPKPSTQTPHQSLPASHLRCSPCTEWYGLRQRSTVTFHLLDWFVVLPSER